MRRLPVVNRSNSRKPHLLTGAKEMVKRIRRPSKAHDMPSREIHAVGPASTGGPVHSGRGSA